jgi:hypothetical protein
MPSEKTLLSNQNPRPSDLVFDLVLIDVPALCAFECLEAALRLCWRYAEGAIIVSTTKASRLPQYSRLLSEAAFNDQ